MRITCPGCGAQVDTTTRTLDTKGVRTMQIVKEHNPLPGNAKKADHRKECPGSKQPAPQATPAA